MSKTPELHTYVLSSLLRTKQLTRELSCVTTSFHYTPNPHPQGRIAESGELPHQICRKAPPSLAPSFIVSKRVIQKYIHFSPGPLYACHGRKENTVRIISPWTLFAQALWSLDDSRTPDGKQRLSQRPLEKMYRTSVGKLEYFLEAVSSPFDLANTKFSFSGRNRSVEDTAYDPRACM